MDEVDTTGSLYRNRHLGRLIAMLFAPAPHGRAVRCSWRIATLWLALVALRPTTAAAEQAPQPAPPQERPRVEEIGGRLLVSGETVVVVGDGPGTGDSTIATKIATPLLETPRSVTIVDRQTLDDMAATNITQAHDYTVGMMPLDERGPAVSRGFPVDFYDLRRDGLRTYSWSIREPVALDRIQYLRGPGAVLYGDGSPGGVVNLVLKKPLPERHVEATGAGGSLEFGRFSLDATGPITGDRRLRYRAIGAGEWLGNGFDNAERRFTVFPTVAFDLNPNATVSFDTEFYTQRGRNYRHVVPATAAAQAGDFSAIPWDLGIASPDDGWTGSNVAPGARLDLTFNSRTSLHVSSRYTRIDGDINLQALLDLAADGRTARRYHYREVSTWDEFQSDAFVATTARTGAIEHRFVGGIEAGLSTTDSEIGVGPAAPIDIYDPQYLPTPTVPTLTPTRYDVSRLGLYVTDHIRLPKGVILVPGLRWSRVTVDDEATTSAPGNQSSAVDAVVSPSLGVVILPRSWLALYSTYARGFEAPGPGQYLQDGRAPQLSSNAVAEAGVKLELGGGRLSVNAAGFGIRRTNVPEADGRGFYQQIGEAESHGLELEVLGEIAPGLSTRAGYAWTKTEVTRDTGAFEGNELPNAPRHKANLWLRYRVPSDRWRGFMVAAGVVHVSDRFTARDNAVIAPRYTRADASASWDVRGPRLTLGLAVHNVTNRRYVTSGAGGVFFAGPPRRVALQLTTRF